MIDGESNCPICNRPLGDSKLIQFHHLIPKTFNGKDGINLHPICHRKIHATFSERELLNHYHTVERIIEHEEIIKFVHWVKNKHVDFYSKNDETIHRKSKRRK